MRLSRRQYLASATSAIAAGLAGCGEVNPLSGGSGQSASESVGLTLDAVEAQGSPSGEVTVKPADQAALVDFFATWCAPCKPQMAELRTVRDEYPDLHLVSITREDDREAIRNFWEEYGGNWPVAIDPQLESFQSYSVQDIPTKVLFTADGEEVWRHTGLAAAETIIGKIEETR